MEDERDREEFKHVCKLCNKRYPSGKSLGGHMRSHVIANANKAKAAQKFKAPVFVADDDDDDEEDDIDNDDDNEIADQDRDKERENGGHSGYGLRENPKKTWRLVDSRLNKQQQQNQQQQERVCKQCGKGFQSLKALCGHMSSHSEKDRNFTDDDNSWSSESHSDDNNISNINDNKYGSNASKRLTRSSISRYRCFTTVDSFGGSSSNNSEIDQQEQEEVAMCLMMLSRDSSGHKSCFNLATESSDNNSVILEGGSSSNLVVGVAKRKDLDLMSNCQKNVKQVLVGGGAEETNVGQEMDNSDSGYFENGAKELESDDSVDGFARNYYYNGFKKPKIDLGSGLVDSNDDYSKKRIRDVGDFDFDSPESEKNSQKIKHDHYDGSSNNPQKESKFECLRCNKSFKTHQALGGHFMTHRRNGESSLDIEKPQSLSAKNLGATTSTITNIAKTMLTNFAKKGTGSKKIKGHKCPYCPKVFKSGQALGGHKRSHMIGSSGGGGGGGDGFLVDRSRAPDPPPEPKQKQPLIDLNLPAPVEEEACGNSQFVAW